MKKNYINILSFFGLSVILIVFILVVHSSQAQTYWVRSAGSQMIDEGTDVSSDAAGNIYTTGYFSGSVDFGGIVASSAGITDVFIMKHNSSGVLQWVVTGGGSGSDRGAAIHADNVGNCYVTGYFFGTATFSGVTIVSQGSQDIFIAKYNTSGILQWVKQGGGVSADIGSAIITDHADNVFVTGQFSGTALFDGQSLTSMTNPSTGLPSFDIFTAKYDSGGNLVWVKQGAAPYTDRGMDLGTDTAGNVYVTGQFSDTITFDQTHNNNMFNAVFLIKYDTDGNEIWFRRAGSTDQCISYAVAVDDSSHIYLTGDFLGSIIFFGNTQYTLSNIYSNNIFLAKYSGAGDLLWAVADGSESAVSARNIALDMASNAYIIGNFRCRFSEYSDVFGLGTFNSIGYNDIYVTKYDPSGSRIWMRNFGSQKDDCGAGISAFSQDNPVVTGSFMQNLAFPSHGNLSGSNFNHNTVNSGKTICGDSYYGSYSGRESVGNQDIFVARAIDLSRQPYDYYNRINGTCDRSFVGSCINDTSIWLDMYCGPDTLAGCLSVSLTCATNTSLYYFPSISVGPVFSFLWSDGYTWRSRTVTTSSWYYVTITSEDGCFESSDSAFAQVWQNPDVPTISDNVGINTNAINTQPISICGDSVILTGGNYGPNSTLWIGPSGYSVTDSIIATCCGPYIFYVIDANGCYDSNYVIVSLQDTLPTVNPGLFLLGDDDQNDSIGICSGNCFTIYPFDSLTCPSGECFCSLYNSYTAYDITPNIPGSDNCFYYAHTYFPTISGFYSVNAEVYYTNVCGGDTFYLSKTVYITVNPSPDLQITVSGVSDFCPGDTMMLVANGTEVIDSIIWIGSGIIGNIHNDTVFIIQPGYFHVRGYTTNAFGCSDADTTIVGIVAMSQPVVTMFPVNGIICPGQDVILTVTGGPNYEWYGPMGLIPGNTSSISANTSGFYYCVVTNGNGCVFISNTVEIKEFATPYLIVIPDNAMLCDGDSAIISVMTNSGSSIQWQPPLSGSDLTQTVYLPGIYYCNITSCGIVTNAIASVNYSNINASITASGPLESCSSDSLTLYCNTPQVSWYWQPGSLTDSGITVFSSGTYTLFVADTYGCTDSDSVDVIIHDIPDIAVSGDTICTGNTATLLAVSDPGVIQWYDQPSGGIPLSSGNTFYTPVLTDTTTYYVQVTDSYCQGIMTQAVVVVNTLPSAFNVGSGGSYCSGGTGVAITLSGSQEGVSYQLQVNGSDIGSPVAGTDNVLNWLNQTSAGNYTVVAVDTATGCTLTMTGSASVTINTNPSADAGADQTIPNGTSTTLNGFASGGSGFYTWKWSPVDSLIISNIQNPVTVNLSNTTVFTITVTDTVTGCTGTDQTTVFIAGSPLAAIATSAPDTICVNATVQLGVNASGGSGNYSYSWTSNPPGFNSFVANPTASPVVTTTYYVDVFDGYSTYTSSVVVIVLDSFPDINPVLSTNSPICAGDTLYLFSDAVSGCQFYWIGPLGFTSALENPFVAPADTVHSGAYNLYVYSDGCYSQTVSVDVIVNPNPEILLCNDTIICPDDTIVLSAAGGISVVWGPATGLNDIYTFLPLAYPQQTTIYSAVITDINGCTDTGNITVELQEGFFIDYGYSTAIIVGESAGLFVTADQDNVTYQWIPSGSLSCNTCATTIATPLETTEYSVIVTDSLDCVSIIGNVLIEIINEFTLDLPTVFTPDGDGVNDIVYVRGWGLKECIWFRIYNRWGEMIFESNDLNVGWDGTFHDIPQNIDSYAYNVKVSTYDGRILTKKGFITLLR